MLQKKGQTLVLLGGIIGETLRWKLHPLVHYFCLKEGCKKPGTWFEKDKAEIKVETVERPQDIQFCDES